MVANPSGTSIDALINAARDNLKTISETEPKIRLALPSISFWLETYSVLEAIQKEIEIKDVSQIKPGSRVNIELEFVAADTTYRIVIRTVVTQGGVFQLRTSEVTDIDFPYSDDDKVWEMVKRFAKENAVPLAGLILSMLNTSLNVLRLSGKL